MSMIPLVWLFRYDDGCGLCLPRVRRNQEPSALEAMPVLETSDWRVKGAGKKSLAIILVDEAIPIASASLDRATRLLMPESNH